MPEKKSTLFDSPGKTNTATTLAAAAERAAELGVDQLVVATKIREIVAMPR